MDTLWVGFHTLAIVLEALKEDLSDFFEPKRSFKDGLAYVILGCFHN